MKPDFIAIHAENVNPDLDSVCHIILIPVKEGIPGEPVEIFANPDAPFDMVVSGITREEVAGFPPFSMEWPLALSLIRKAPMVVCSAEGQSARSIHATLSRLGIPAPEIPFINAKAICRRSMDEVSYSLDYLAYKLLVSTVSDDQPVEKLRLWTELVLLGLESREENDLKEFAEAAKIKIGSFGAEPFEPSRCRKIYSNRQGSHASKFDPSAVPVNADPDHPFYGTTVVFTGKMQMKRADARAAVISVGGMSPDTLTSATEILVVGDQDLRVVGPSGLSGKMKKAQQLRDKGSDIEIISESDFLELLGKK